MCFASVSRFFMLYGYVYSASRRKAIQRRSKRDRKVKRKVFKLRWDAGDIPCSITLWSAGGVSFQSAGLTTAKNGTRVQEDLRDEQSAAGKRSEQIAV